MPHDYQNRTESGVGWQEADKVFIMLHGRGAPASDIMGLAPHLKAGKVRFIAPEADQYTWYPYGFMEHPSINEPYLSDALKMIGNIEEEVVNKGFETNEIFLLGFSQGACLASEYAARNPKKYGGVFALTGGLIGDDIAPSNYEGNMQNTPIFLANSDQDPHIPVERSKETEEIFNRLNGDVCLKIYPGMPHTVNEDEIRIINEAYLKSSR